MLHVLCDAFDAMKRAAGPAELRIEMDRFARQLGFERFAYVLSVTAPSLKPQQYILNGFPQSWLDRYLAEDYFKVDPLIKFAHQSTLPAIWDDEIFHDGASAAFWEEAHAHGLQGGISFSVHEQSGVTGIFSIARDKPLELREVDLAAVVGRGQVFASLLHHAVMRLELPRLLPKQHALLTGRERECLRWAAEGKTAWEIGQIMGISERTAVFHINNVIQKLDAANKTQAIVRALTLKLL